MCIMTTYHRHNRGYKNAMYNMHKNVSTHSTPQNMVVSNIAVSLQGARCLLE